MPGGCAQLERWCHAARKPAIPVISSSYRLVSSQRASFKTVPPPWGRLSFGGQSELVLWWFVPDLIHGTSSSTPMSRHKRTALAVTNGFRQKTSTTLNTDHRGFFVDFIPQWTLPKHSTSKVISNLDSKVSKHSQRKSSGTSLN